MTESKYVWATESSVKIEDFVKKFRPSIITDDLTDWIWVQGAGDSTSDPERDKSHIGALTEATRIMKETVKKLEEVETDDSIPVRAKKGQKSKKGVRDEILDGAKVSLKNLSIAKKWTTGKWLLFPKHENVDSVWLTLAQSVAKGPLKEAGVELAKVAPTPASLDEGQDVTHLICLYIANVYDLTLVRKVLTTLLTCHGIEPSAVKSDLYTLADIDSNHPSKLRSSIWRPNEVIEGGNEAIKKLTEEYYAKKTEEKNANKVKQEPRTSKVGRDGLLESDSEDERISVMNKRKASAPLSSAGKHGGKKAVVDHDDEEDNKTAVKAEPPEKTKTETETKSALKRTGSAAAALKFKDNDIFADPSDSE